MFLKSLELHGFKSFPDKTTVNFDAGITAIVGPNGSGKSNIVDAIRWVLGEQNSRTLRGMKMEDIIFNGTSTRKPTSFAEVAMTLDNSTKWLPVDFNEVTITRRLYRSGESEYFINRASVRLKDINELFMNTGLGKDGYSVIGQGKISDILSAKSDERRQIFEEAAGISKYRYRKVESERKLDATNENLLRVKDILNELTERVEPLREQSEKAKQYLTLREEKKQLEINVWMDSIEKTKDILKKNEEAYHLVKDDLDKLSDTYDSSEKEIDRQSELMQQCNVDIENLNIDIKNLEQLTADLQAKRAVTENDIGHNNDNRERLKQGMSDKQNQLIEYDAVIELKKAEADGKRQQANEMELELTMLLEESERQLSEKSELSEKSDLLRADMLLCTNEQTEARIRCTSLATLMEEQNKRIETIDEDILGKQSILKTRVDERKSVRIKLEEAEENLLSIANVLNGFARKKEVRQARLDELTAKHKGIDSKIVDKTHRFNMLVEMEKSYEGFGHAVKHVMQEAERGRLRGVCGTINELIEVPAEYTTAVETALGGAIQNIVVEAENDAKAAILLLKNAAAGRATFLPVNTIKGNLISENDLSACAGFVGIASELIRYDAKYTGIFVSLLGRTVIAENIDNAIAIAKKYQYRFRVVTLDGQVVNAGGSMTGGSQSKGSGVLSRKNDIDKLEEELKVLRTEEGALSSEMMKLSAETAALSAGLDGAVAEQNVANEQKIRVSSELTQYNQLIDALQIAIDELQMTKKQLGETIGRSVIEYDKLQHEIGEFADKLSSMEKEFEALSGSHVEAVKLRENLLSIVSEKRLEINSVRKDIESIELSAGETLRQKELFLLTVESDASAMEQLAVVIAELEAQMIAMDEEVQAIKNKVAALYAEIDTCQKNRNLAEKRVTEIRHQTKELIAKRESLIKEVSRLEAKKAGIETEYDAVIARLWDEYELTPAECQPLRTELTSIPAANRRVSEIKAKIKQLGDVNVGAIEEYKAVKERYEFLTVQVGDLERSRDELLAIIENLTEQMRSLFVQQFKTINFHFNRVFVELFGGGSATLELSDPSDVLLSGIEIKVQPPGKIIKNLTALSGGEQAFVAIALYFAILYVKPSTFCILDEIEAALDDVNVSRFAAYLRKMAVNSQYICVTHRRGTMEEADILYGVTMQEQGVTKLLTINVAEAERHLVQR